MTTARAKKSSKTKRSFPRETIKLAREIGRKYRARDKSKLKQAKCLYNGEFYHIRYGFSEGLRNGNYAMFLHEIKKEAECFALAGAVLYPLAKEIGLKPKLVRMYGMQDLADGQDPDDKMICDHSFIICDLGKRQQVVDTFMSAFGKARFVPGKNVLEIYNAKDGTLIKRSFAHMQVMSEQEFLKEFEKASTPEGARHALAETQRVHGAKWQVFVTYFPETSEIRTQLRFSRGAAREEPRNKNTLVDLITKVNEDGTYDFNEGRFEFYNAAGFDWANAKDPQVPLVCPVALAQKIWPVWEAIVKSTGRKSRIGKMNIIRLGDILYTSGFQESFTPVPGSKAARIISRKKLQGNIRAFKRGVGKVLSDYVERVKEDEYSFKLFLRSCHRAKASDATRSKKNPWGFIFSDEEHLAYLQEAFEGYKEHLKQLFEDYHTDAAIRAKLKKGSNFHQDRVINAKSAKIDRDLACFRNMVGHRRNYYPQIFAQSADMALFDDQIDVDNKSVEELLKGLSKKDLIRGAEMRLFAWLINALRDKDTSFLGRFKSGLQKMLGRKE
jgi:hypothetical protein